MHNASIEKDLAVILSHAKTHPEHVKAIRLVIAEVAKQIRKDTTPPRQSK